MGTKQMASKCSKQNSRLWGAWLWILAVTARQPLRLAALSTRWPVALVSNVESNGFLILMFHQGEFIDTIRDFIKKGLYFQASTCLEPSRSSFLKAGVTIQTLEVFISRQGIFINFLELKIVVKMVMMQSSSKRVLKTLTFILPAV